MDTNEKPKEELNGSILDSVKKMLGIPQDSKEFDLDLMMHINSAVSTLSQIGVGFSHVFFVTSNNETFLDYLGEEQVKLIPHVSLYLFYRVKLGFDTPLGNIMTEVLKEVIKELEFRISVEVDPKGSEV